jgi:hypothetical protein
MEQVRRDESFSRQAVPHLLEPPLSYSGYPADNRSRSYTADDSTQSSSDNSSKDKITGPRRRSHRPRGCRGGRKNRKTRSNNSILLTVPKEIIGGSTPLSTCENLRPSGSSKPEGDQKREREIEYAKSKSWTQHSVPDENGIHVEHFSMFPPTMQSVRKEHASNTPTFRPPVLEQSSFLPPLGRATSMRTSGLPNGMGAHSILPPLPMAQVNGPVLDGPNPYALSYATSGSPKPYNWTSNHSNRSANAIQRPVQVNRGGNSADTTVDYRNLRIEKQRQMLADGGSLFATSPRSFLMGRNSAVAMSW